MYDRQALIDLAKERALELGEFTLASGKTSHYYLDCRRLTLDGQGVSLIANGMLEMLGDSLPDAIGGMAIGADPITAAVITVAASQGRNLKGFIVRKEVKSHGKGRMVEGPVKPGDRVMIVEDVVTTGGSSLQAIEHVERFGMQVEGVIAIIDRLEGGSNAFSEQGYSLRSLLTIRDLGVDPAGV